MKEFLEPHGISPTDFARRLGISFVRLNELINRHWGMTPDTALRLEKVVGMPADFWLGLQLDWDLWRAMRSEDAKKIAKLRPLQPA